MNKCKDCKKENTCPSKEGSHKYCFEPKPQTNYDRIKSMSVEEMARLFEKMQGDAVFNHNSKYAVEWKTWLEREVKE